MPKIVDPDRRRQELGEAVLRVIQRDGVAGASLRNVAKEAGMSMGALRHYFDTHDDLLTFSLKLIGERIRTRLTEAQLPEDPRQLAEHVIRHILPVDEPRRLEAEVWLAFVGASLTNPALHAYQEEVHDGLRSIVDAVLRGLQRAGALHPGLDFATEAIRFHALMDGLALHAVIRPDVVTDADVTAALKRHFDDLCRAPDPK